MGGKEVNIHKDQLDPGGRGELLAQEGDEIIFPLVEDEDGNVWAWSPIIPQKQEFVGTIAEFNDKAGFGTLRCEVISKVFDDDVYLKGAACSWANVDTRIGTRVVFNLA